MLASAAAFPLSAAARHLPGGAAAAAAHPSSSPAAAAAPACASAGRALPWEESLAQKEEPRRGGGLGAAPAQLPLHGPGAPCRPLRRLARAEAAARPLGRWAPVRVREAAEPALSLRFLAAGLRAVPPSLDPESLASALGEFERGAPLLKSPSVAL